jgi:hypothetical protein
MMCSSSVLVGIMTLLSSSCFIDRAAADFPGDDDPACQAAWEAVACNSKGSCPTCGERINWMLKHTSSTLDEARDHVGVTEFPEICGDCAANLPSSYPEWVEEDEGCRSQWLAAACKPGGSNCPTCGSRIEWLTDENDGSVGRLFRFRFCFSRANSKLTSIYILPFPCCGCGVCETSVVSKGERITKRQFLLVALFMFRMAREAGAICVVDPPTYPT